MRVDGPVVADTGPLIHLGDADALDLLDQFETLVLPETVFAELQAGEVPAGVQRLDYERRPISVDDETWPTLDPGETAALELCRRLDGMLVTDDLDARQGLPTTASKSTGPSASSWPHTQATESVRNALEL